MPMKITSARFAACVTGKAAIPTDGLPMIALVGRSNVGKSSLINTLTGRRELAKTSSTPGKTLTCNFYLINESFYLVDLPGYGYAKVSRVSREKIQTMVDEFFTDNNRLKGIMQVMDLRHPPSTMDISMFNWIRGGASRYLPLVTKTDKLGQGEMHRMLKLFKQKMDAPSLIGFSAKTGQGKEDLLDALQAMINDEEFSSPRMRMPDRGPNRKGKQGRDRTDGRRDNRGSGAPREQRPQATPGEAASTPEVRDQAQKSDPRETRDNRGPRDNRPRQPQERRPVQGQPGQVTSQERPGPQGQRGERGPRPGGPSQPRPQALPAGSKSGETNGPRLPGEPGPTGDRPPQQGQGSGRRRRRPHHRRPDSPPPEKVS